MSDRQLLGHVKVQSGKLLLVDMGVLNLWCHDNPPQVPEVIMPESSTDAANSAQDFHIEGPDAEKAGRLFGRQWHPLYLYDIPGNGINEFKRLFEDFLKQQKLRATLVSIEPRVTHRKRIDQALSAGNGAGEVFFSGITAVALEGIPCGTQLPVYGTRMDQGEYANRWREIYLEITEGVVAGSRAVGEVAVDTARLMFVDADALAEWKHDETIDGCADFVFWGQDARDVVTTFNAGKLPDGTFGWMNLPVHHVVEMGLAVQEYMQNANLKLAIDFRPHSHHYDLMSQIRSSDTESGTMELAENEACAFMTSWGDGYFPVFEDQDSGGKAVRLRIDLGNEQTLKRIESLGVST